MIHSMTTTRPIGEPVVTTTTHWPGPDDPDAQSARRRAMAFFIALRTALHERETTMSLSKRIWLTLTVAVTAATFCVATAQAKKPDKPGGGGGGGNQPVATGQLYYQSPGVWELPADGSPATELGVENGREPSHQNHNGFRWFLNSGGSGTLTGTRYDGAATVTLVDSPGLYVDPFSMRWVNSTDSRDSSVAFKADEIDIDPTSPTFGNSLGASLYIASVQFDAGGMPLLSSQPAVLIDDVGEGGFDFDFSFDGNLLVYEHSGSLFISDLQAQQATPLPVAGVEAALPQFSQDGSRIAYRAWDRTSERKNLSAIQVVDLSFENGQISVDSEMTVASETLRKRGGIGGSVIFSGPFWSPDGNFLAYVTETSAGYERDYSIMRIRDDGSHPTNLLPDDGGTQSLFLRGWRDSSNDDLLVNSIAAIPEPSAFALAAFGLLGWTVRARSIASC
jgi:hypothetical protein